MDKQVEQLVKTAQNGDAKAFANLYDLFSDKIFRYIKLKIQNQHQAEDVLQDTFIKAWKALPKYKTAGGNFNAWLYRIASNAINDYFRELYRKPETLEFSEEIELTSSHSLLEHALLQADVESVKAALSFIPAGYRQVLELRFIQDFSVGETADILNKSNLAVRIMQHRALKLLREIINKQNDLEYSAR